MAKGHENIIPPKKGEPTRNPKGRGKGVPNRSTVAKKVLAMIGNKNMPTEILDKIKEEYPNAKLSVEEIMTWQQVIKAIGDSDTSAYKAIMDSAYGQPKQEIEQESVVKFNNLPEWMNDES